MATTTKVRKTTSLVGNPPVGSRLNPLVVECVLDFHPSAWTLEGEKCATSRYRFAATGTLSTTTKKNPKVFKVDAWEVTPSLPEIVLRTTLKGRPYKSKLITALRRALAQAAGTERAEGLSMRNMMQEKDE